MKTARPKSPSDWTRTFLLREWQRREKNAMWGKKKVKYVSPENRKNANSVI